MKQHPIWAPPYVNVYGNPFAAGLPYHFAGAATPMFSDSSRSDRQSRSIAKQTFLDAIPPTSPAGVDTTLSYIVYRSHAQNVLGATWVALFGNALISHRNVLLEFADNRFVRTPAYIFLRAEIDFNGYDGDRFKDVHTLIQRNAENTAKRLKGPWLWQK